MEDRAPAERIPLDREIRQKVDTDTCAFHIGRAAKTLRNWSSSNEAPIRPTKCHGRLMWSVADIRKFLAGGA